MRNPTIVILAKADNWTEENHFTNEHIVGTVKPFDQVSDIFETIEAMREAFIPKYDHILDVYIREHHCSI